MGRLRKRRQPIGGDAGASEAVLKMVIVVSSVVRVWSRPQHRTLSPSAARGSLVLPFIPAIPIGRARQEIALRGFQGSYVQSACGLLSPRPAPKIAGSLALLDRAVSDDHPAARLHTRAAVHLATYPRKHPTGACCDGREQMRNTRAPAAYLTSRGGGPPSLSVATLDRDRSGDLTRQRGQR